MVSRLPCSCADYVCTFLLLLLLLLLLMLCNSRSNSRLDDVLSTVRELLSTSALADAESAAYWAYHLGRTGFFLGAVSEVLGFMHGSCAHTVQAAALHMLLCLGCYSPPSKHLLLLLLLPLLLDLFILCSSPQSASGAIGHHLAEQLTALTSGSSPKRTPFENLSANARNEISNRLYEALAGGYLFHYVSTDFVVKVVAIRAGSEWC